MAVSNITANEYSVWLARGDKAVLLDVRDDWEHRLAHVAGALHIPMDQIPERLAELDRDATIVVMCHTGGRSLAIANFLQQKGFSAVLNLNGGIDAWAIEVETSLPRY